MHRELFAGFNAFKYQHKNKIKIKNKREKKKIKSSKQTFFSTHWQLQRGPDPFCVLLSNKFSVGFNKVI